MLALFCLIVMDDSVTILENNVSSYLYSILSESYPYLYFVLIYENEYIWLYSSQRFVYVQMMGGVSS